MSRGTTSHQGSYERTSFYLHEKVAIMPAEGQAGFSNSTNQRKEGNCLFLKVEILDVHVPAVRIAKGKASRKQTLYQTGE